MACYEVMLLLKCGGFKFDLPAEKGPPNRGVAQHLRSVFLAT